VLESRRPKRLIGIVIHGEGVLFEYSIPDPTTRTMLTYRGTHGDPELDEQVRITGADDLFPQE